MKSKLPLSLYVHIPFCVRKCLYCDFLSADASEEMKEAYVKALLGEMDFWREEIQERYQISTIFIGGGTPTCLNPDKLLSIGEKLRELCTSGKMMEDAKTTDIEKCNFRHSSAGKMLPLEFTIEANPGTVTSSNIRIMQEIGVNRISLGLQSAQNNELKELGRIHTYEEFLKSYDLLRSYGFGNINIDLMADIPKQTIQTYQDTLEKVLALAPEHISSYSLIVEEGTPFYQMQEEGKLLIPDEDTDREMYELTRELLGQKGYERYEISNYARAGMECRHNLTYWQMGEYLGLGLGAASFLGGYRFSNVRQLDEYIRRFDGRSCVQVQGKKKTQSYVRSQQRDAGRPESYFQGEDSYAMSLDERRLEQKLEKAESFHKLSKKEEMEEYAFLGLRTRKGISLPEYKERFGVNFREIYQGVLDTLIKKCLLAENENHDRISLTNRGIDVSNMVLAEFLLE